MNKTPKYFGYRMSAEFEKQEAVWIAWPHNKDTWPDELLEDVEKSYVEFVKALHSGQKVKILVDDKKIQEKIIQKLNKWKIDISQIIFYKIKTIDAWIRDYGPTFVINNKKQKAMVKWYFNAWGNKYDDLKEDDKIPYDINKIMKLRIFEPKIVLEGGSIDVNGSGTLLTTEQCLLNENRNPQLTKQQIEQYLKDYLNVSNILWLKEGIAGDDTDGHIDDIARFVNKNTVVCAFEDNKDDENYKFLKENYELLKNMKDENGNKLNIVKLPMPKPIEVNNQRLPASYANFYIGNEAVAVPIFWDENDKKALKIIQNLFPNKKIIDIDCRTMVYGLGALHCLSMQEPKI